MYVPLMLLKILAQSTFPSYVSLSLSPPKSPPLCDAYEDHGQQEMCCVEGAPQTVPGRGHKRGGGRRGVGRSVRGGMSECVH